MRNQRIAIPLTLAALSTATPAAACMEGAPLHLEDVRYADVVVVGRIANYRIVPDPVARREDRKWHAKYARKYPESAGDFEEMDRYMSDYAKFDIVVDEVLLGNAGSKVVATWDNSTFEEPESMPPGPFVIALRRGRSVMPPLRGISATILPNPERGIATVLQAPCAPEFIFESTSERAIRVRAILARPAKPAKRGRSNRSGG